MLIIASIGVTTTSESDIRKIILAGADIIRHNFSYYSVEKNIEHIHMVQKIVDDLNAHIKNLIDFPLSKIRLGDFNLKVFAVREGEEFTFQSGSYTNDCNEFIPVQVPKLGEKVNIEQTITLGDGEIAIQVTDIINSETIRGKILNNGVIRYIKSFNLKNYTPPIQEILNVYSDIILKTNEIKPEFYAWSYINKQVNDQLKHLPELQNLSRRAKIIIKIENQDGVDDIEEICQDSFYDMVMIDRGEMGVNMPFEKIGIYQKQIQTTAAKYRKPVIVSTQILDSAIHNYIPSRSDILNLTNIVLDGAAGIMLCHETVGGSRPAYPIHTAKKIVSTVENIKNQFSQQ